MAEVREIRKKMCMIGDGAVGKTSLIRRFVVGNFDDKYVVTIGARTMGKHLEINNGNETSRLKLQIWDILGARSHSKLQKTAFKGADGAFLVLDLTRRETLYSFDLWLHSLFEVTGEIPVVVLANKSDLKPEFGCEEIKELTDDYGIPFYITSAKTGENVNDAFNTLGEMIVKPWAGVKTKPRLDMSKIVSMKLGPEPTGKLTALEVEDMIMASYCELLKDTDLAMALFRDQVEKAGIDFMHPSQQGLTTVAGFLLDAASDRVDPSRLQKEREAYTDLIGRIG
ncbi:MAG: GTP-binding protein [Thermoplasmata archaeon]|nr:MAG: GTP-binding protein [Thermoplasmata archaeon]